MAEQYPFTRPSCSAIGQKLGLHLLALPGTGIWVVSDKDPISLAGAGPFSNQDFVSRTGRVEREFLYSRTSISSH